MAPLAYKAPDERGFHSWSSLYFRAREPKHLDLDAAQHDTEFPAGGARVVPAARGKNCSCAQAGDIRALVPLEIVNPTRFSSSAICLLRAGWPMANHSAVREKFRSSDMTETARRRRSTHISSNTTSEVANHLRTNGTLLRQRALHRLDFQPIDPGPLAADDPHPVHQ